MKNFIAAIAILSVASIGYAQELTGSYPAEGGAITVTSSGGVVSAAGLDFVSSNDGLRPTGGVPAPFAFLLSDTSSQVTYGNLGSTVDIDGDLTLSVGANADAEISASWGMGAVPVAFPVAPIGGPTGAAISWGEVVAAMTFNDLLGSSSGSIAFTGVEYDGGNAAGTFFTGDGGDTGSPSLNEIYDSHGWNGAGATITLEGLTEGESYMVQLLGAGDTRGCCNTRSQAADDGMGNVSGDFYRGASSVTGTFTAAGATQAINIISGSDNGVDPGLSGYIVADSSGAVLSAFNIAGGDATVTIPEPASAAMALLAGLAMLSIRRKR